VFGGEIGLKEDEMSRNKLLFVALCLFLLALNGYRWFQEMPLEQAEQTRLFVRDLLINLAIIIGGFIIPITSIYRIYRDWRYGTMGDSEAEEGRMMKW